MSMKKIKIITADDHSILQEGLCSALETENDIVVVARANSGYSAVELTNLHRPDLVIMDVSMSDISGMVSTRMIKEKNPDIPVLALSMHMEKIYIKSMMDAGASGYVLKSSSITQIVEGIRTVVSGERYFCKEIRSLVAQIDAEPEKEIPEPHADSLTIREKEVLQLIAGGLKTKKIADKLNISIKTVDVHRAKMKAKLNLQSVAELTKFAIAEGLTPSKIKFFKSPFRKR
jgi:DNA-binding NarL/FixJ family response regulator